MVGRFEQIHVRTRFPIALQSQIYRFKMYRIPLFIYLPYFLMISACRSSLWCIMYIQIYRFDASIGMIWSIILIFLIYWYVFFFNDKHVLFDVFLGDFFAWIHMTFKHFAQTFRITYTSFPSKTQRLVLILQK